MGIPILVRRHLYIVTASCTFMVPSEDWYLANVFYQYIFQWLCVWESFISIFWHLLRRVQNLLYLIQTNTTQSVMCVMSGIRTGLRTGSYSIFDMLFNVVTSKFRNRCFTVFLSGLFIVASCLFVCLSYYHAVRWIPQDVIGDKSILV